MEKEINKILGKVTVIGYMKIRSNVHPIGVPEEGNRSKGIHSY